MPYANRSVVLVEDDQLTRALMEGLLRQMSFDVAAAVGTATEGLEAVRECDPDLLITDLDLGNGPTGLELVRKVEEQCPWISVLLLTVHSSVRLFTTENLPANRHRGLLVKSEIHSPEDLRLAIDACMSGNAPDISASVRGIPITPDQAEALRLLAQGLSNKEIARLRNTSVRAVENLTQRLYLTLHLTGDDRINPRAAAIRMFQTAQVTVL